MACSVPFGIFFCASTRRPEIFAPAIIPVHAGKNIAKTFRATIFAIRNHTLSDKPSGWSYNDVEDLGWLKDLLNKSTDILDNF